MWDTTGLWCLRSPTAFWPPFGDAAINETCNAVWLYTLIGGVDSMKYLAVAGLMAASLACVPLAMADEPMNDSDSSHHFVKDSLITTKVKSKLAEKHLTTLTRIKVDTDENGVVWLSGHAPTQDAVDLATMIAKNTDGVTSVHNDVAVQP
jgi:hyperosmotically inducible protein